MAEDLIDVLKDVSVLLRHIADQNEKSAKRVEESRVRAEQTRGKMQERMEEAKVLLERNRERRVDFQKSREDTAKRIEESRSAAARQREEDLEFRERLLTEIKRHNHLLETLVAKLNQR